MEQSIDYLMKENKLLTQLVELYQEKNTKVFESLEKNQSCTERTVASMAEQQKTASKLFDDLSEQQKVTNSTLIAMAEQQKDTIRLYNGLHAKYIFLLQTNQKETQSSAAVLHHSERPQVPEVSKPGWWCTRLRKV